MDSEYKRKKCILDIETTSFHPWSGRIICIGIKNINSGEIKIFQNEKEEVTILQFLQYFKKNKFEEIIGYNISYDIRYIFGKCLRYRIPADYFFSATHTDIMMTLKGVKHQFNFNRPGRMDEWTRFLLDKNKLLRNTSIRSLYIQGKIKEIVEYNQRDLELTYELWKRIKFVLQGINVEAQ